jgi:hypothetical protein
MRDDDGNQHRPFLPEYGTVRRATNPDASHRLFGAGRNPNSIFLEGRHRPDEANGCLVTLGRRWATGVGAKSRWDEGVGSIGSVCPCKERAGRSVFALDFYLSSLLSKLAS